MQIAKLHELFQIADLGAVCRERHRWSDLLDVGTVGHSFDCTKQCLFEIPFYPRPIIHAAHVKFVWPLEQFNRVPRKIVSMLEKLSRNRAKIASRIDYGIESNAHFGELDPASVEHGVVVGVLKVHPVAEMPDSDRS